MSLLSSRWGLLRSCVCSDDRVFRQLFVTDNGFWVSCGDTDSSFELVSCGNNADGCGLVSCGNDDGFRI